MSVAVRYRQTWLSKGDVSNKLQVRISKSYIVPGESYYFYATNRNTNAGYSGTLEVDATFCDQYGKNCQTYKGPWKNYDGSVINVSNGFFVVNVPGNTGKSVVKARWRPNANWDWSNEVKTNIGTTYGLKNTKNFWIFWTDEKEYLGSNNVYNKTFKTWIRFSSPTTTCGVTGRWMFHKKDNEYGYWGPKTPWYSVRRYDTDFKWFLPSWKKTAGWHDTYLTAYGGPVYAPLNKNFNDNYIIYSMKFATNDPTLPNYMLSPEWIQSGYGVGTNKARYGKRESTNPNICDIPIPTEESIWSIHGDILNLTIKRNNGTTSYNGPALRIKFYEGAKTYMSPNSPNEFLREDYWFIENVGLVKIDVKSFGNWQGPLPTPTPTPSDYNIKKNCKDDSDCFINEVMQAPHVTLTRADYK